MAGRPTVFAIVRGDTGMILSAVQLPDGRYAVRAGTGPAFDPHPATPEGLDACLDELARRSNRMAAGMVDPPEPRARVA